MGPTSNAPIRWALIGRWVAPILLLGVCAGVVWVLPDVLLAYPRWVRSRATEWFLRALLVGYWLAVTAAGPGTVVLSVLAYRAWRAKRPRPRSGRGVLVCVSLGFSLVLMEAGAAAWGAWIHRMPALPVTFPPAPADEINIVVIGESSARGVPYQPLLSIGQIIGWQLERALPGRRVRVDVLAEPGVTLERMHQKLEGLERRPDALIVYCGHNEFQARYDWGRDVAHDEAPANRVLNRLFHASLGSPLCRMIYETVSKHRLDAAPAMGQHHLIDPPLCSPSEYARILADFHRRLEAIAAYCDRIGAVPILVIPPGNEGGFEPNRSSLPGSSAGDRRALVRLFEAARASEEDPPRALELYRALLERFPGFAEAHFRLGRLHEQRGERDDANRDYIRARDADTFPQRCPTSFQEVYRAVAARHGRFLIDGPAVLRAASPGGVLNDNLCHDFQHPNLVGYLTLAQAVLNELRERRAFGWTDGMAPKIDAETCATHFGIDPRMWGTICARSSWFYQVTARSRFDPTERLAKEKCYAAAERRIAAGTAPELAGIPGLGVRPRPVANPDWASRVRVE